MFPYKSFVGIIFLVSICCILPFILLLVFGYLDRMQKNDNFVMTNCIIIEHQIVEITCYRTCRCGTGPLGRDIKCDNCPFSCYDGFIVLEHFDEDINSSFSGIIDIKLNDEFAHNVERELLINYPMNETISCYYDSNDPTQIKLNIDNEIIFLIFAIIFLIFGVIIMCIWSLFAWFRHHFFYISP